MTDAEYGFFAGHSLAWPIYQELTDKLVSTYPDIKQKVQKTQIT